MSSLALLGSMTATPVSSLFLLAVHSSVSCVGMNYHDNNLAPYLNNRSV